MRFSIEGELHSKADLDSFVARFKEIFEADCQSCAENYASNAQQNQITLVGVASSIWGEGEPDYAALSVDLPGVANPIKLYLRGSARLFHRNLPLAVGDWVAVVARFDVDEDGDCQFYISNASDIQKIDLKGSDLP